MIEIQPTPPHDISETPVITGAAQGVSILTVVFLIIAVLGYVFTVALSWLLPVDQYGIYGVCVALFGVLGLFVSTAFPWAATKYMSAEINLLRRYTILKTSFTGNILIVILVIVVFYFYTTRVSQTNLGMPLVILLCATLFVYSPLNIYLGAFQGLFRFQQLGIVQLLMAMTRFVAGISLAYFGFGAYGAFTGYLIAAVVTILAAAYFLRDFKFWKGPGWAVSRVLSFAPAMFIGAMGIILLSNIDILGIKMISDSVLSSELTGYYQSALVLAKIPLLIAGAMMMALFPFISKYSVTSERDYPFTALKYSAIFVLPLSIILTASPSSLILLFFPPAYLAGAEALRIIAIGMGFLSIIQVLSNIFQAQAKPWIPAISLTVAAAIQIAGLIILIPQWGISGAATATTIASLLGVVYLLIRYLRMSRHIVSVTYISKLVVAAGLPGSILFIISPESKIVTITCLIFFLLLYCFLLAGLKLISGQDIEILKNSIPRIVFIDAILDLVNRIIVRLNRLTG